MHISTNFAGSEFNWLVSESSPGTLELSADPHSSYNEFIKIVSAHSFELAPQRYQKISQHFVSSSNTAALLMPKENLKTAFRNAEELLQDALADTENQRYFESWTKIYQFLETMHRSRVDNTELEKIRLAAPNENSKVLCSFEPEDSGFVRKVKYTTSASVTGRLGVVSGPQILTAPKEVRHCLRSTFKSGDVFIVDFVSMEPRVAMVTSGLVPPEDVYQDLLEEFPNLSRTAAKLVTLSALYGSSANSLSGSVGNLSDARKAIAFVRSHFRVDAMERKLSDQADRSLVRNIFGRPLREATKNPRIRVNHYLQSSAAELSVLLFSELCEKFGKKVRPFFVIHDALVVDVHSDVKEAFQEAANSIRWKENLMPVKVEQLSPI